MHRLPIVAAALVISVPAVALDLPSRKPGLWEMRMSFQTAAMPAQVIQHCVDAATDKQMNAFGDAASKEACSSQNVSTSGGTMIVDSVCRVGGATAATRTEISGSFDSAYTVKSMTKRDGAAAAGADVTIEAKWLGPCKDGQKPGDFIMANGLKMNIADMKKLQALRPGGMMQPPAR
jgi:hypothetical protein